MTFEEKLNIVRAETIAEMTETAIINLINKGIKYNIDKEDIKNDLMADYELAEDSAKSYIDQYWK